MHFRPGTAIPLLVLSLVLGATSLALGSAGARAEDLDDVTHVDGTSLDSVDSESDGEALDQADSGDDGEPLGDVPDVGPGVPDVTESQSLDAAPQDESLALDQAERAPGWRPLPCGELALDLPPAPDAGDVGAWTATLRAAEESVGRSRAALQRADAAYSRSLTSHEPLGQERAEIIQARDRARSDYSRARCALPAWLERARRAGVEPGILRPFAGG